MTYDSDIEILFEKEKLCKSKKRKFDYQHLFPFRQCFQKLSSQGSLENWIVWERVKPFPNKPLFLCVCSTSLLITLWEKEKLLVMSHFSFSHSVFYPDGEVSAIFLKFKFVVYKLFQFGRVLNLSFGKGLNSETLKYKLNVWRQHNMTEAINLFMIDWKTWWETENAG